MNNDDIYKNSDKIDGTNNFKNNIAELNNQFIKVIDIDDLPPEDLIKIIVMVGGSKNMAHYLALIVNLENRSRKISPQGVAKILSSKSVNAPNSNPTKTSFAGEVMLKNANEFNKV